MSIAMLTLSIYKFSPSASISTALKDELYT
jgi:hypothetical protein